MADLIAKPYIECLSWKNKAIRLAWEIFRHLFFLPAAGPWLRKYRVFILRLWGAKIGKGCAISNKSWIYQPWELQLGNFVAVGENTALYNCAPIIADDGVVISQRAYLCTASHDISSTDNHLVTAPIRLRRFSWVAADAFIGMGVTVGDGAVVGARAAVFKDVESWTVVGGNPAKFIKKREIRA